jgi:hypothetical protein
MRWSEGARRHAGGGSLEGRAAGDAAEEDDEHGVRGASDLQI